MILYHGSSVIVEKPLFGYGKEHNDYGQGFYCTEDIALANEWACSGMLGGFTNVYELDAEDLSTLVLDEQNIISWITLLIHNRIVRYGSPIEKQGAEYLTARFLPDISGYDLIEGYRADDSYFTYARAFLANTISIGQLAMAMILGTLGRQVCLKSKKSFDAISFREAIDVDGSIYYPKRMERDKQARDNYYHLLEQVDRNGIFIRDIIAKEMTIDELRIS
jgi:hypothetical protein